ncbi:MAG: murein L,D-transpeptidase [Candidatus Moraniibacteriota bacterium]|nr:MAG: murein L,D-transpeptidase [Candidatus Moranbacteria bacterium]
MRRAITFFFFWIIFAALILGLFGLTFWYWELRRTPVTITVTEGGLMGPRQPISLHFSQSVQPNSFDHKLSIEPAHPLRLEWHDHNRTLLVIPELNWPLESRYQLTLGSGKTSWFGSTPESTWRIEGPRYPSITKTEPETGAKEVLLGIEDPIKVTFDISVKDFFIDFRLEPKAEVIYQNNETKTEFALLPKTILPAGTTHTLSIFAKWRGEPDSEYHFLGATTFATLPPTPTTWNRDLALRTDEAKRLTRPQKTDGKYIDINLGSQVMTLFEDGRAIDSFIISSGKRGMDTPRGEFAVQNKANRPWSKQYGLYMPYWQAITPDGKYGIHELPEWPGGYKEGANHLGTPVSHGCVRLGVGAAERVFAWSDIGTPIVIY